MFRVLLIQPERIFLTVFARSLQERGYKVCVADNEKAGIDCLRHTQPDLVLCSYRIGPTNDDLNMVRNMRRINRDVPIIVASTSGFDLVLEIRDAGASLVVSRTLDGEAIAALVDQIAPSFGKNESAEDLRIANRGSLSNNQELFSPALIAGAVSSN